MKTCKCGCGTPLPDSYMKSKEYLFGHNPKPTYDLKRQCLCGCKGLIRDQAVSRYIRGHAPKQHKPTYKLGRICACGCGKPNSDKNNSEYIKGHVTAMYDKMCYPLCACGCGKFVEHPANKYYKDHSRYDKDISNKIKEKLKTICKDPEYLKRRSDSMIRVNLIKKIKMIFKEDDLLDNSLIEDLDNKIDDIEYKEKMLIIVKSYDDKKERLLKKEKERIKNSPEAIERRRLAIINGQTPESIEKIRKKLVAFWADPANREKYSGENSCHWRGGVSQKGYCKEFKKPFKEEIMALDEFKCRNPYCTNGGLLSVHHIDYDKMNCVWLNLISVCRSCNTRANYHRRYWRRLYTRLRKFGFNPMCQFVYGA